MIGCTQVPPMLKNTNAIATVTAQKAGDRVRLDGVVEEVAPFLKGGAYLLVDKSGEVWIVTQEELPQVGDRAILEGEIVYTKVAIASQQLGEVYVTETQRLKVIHDE